MQFRILLHFFAIVYVSNAEERIIGGEITTHVIPHQVSLQFGDKFSHFCGGSIINENFVLTAAHCFELFNSPANITVVVGTEYVRHHGTKYASSKLILHERFNNETFANDIALIKTTVPIKFTKHVQPIKLYTDEIPDDSEMLASGWGINRNIKPSKYLKVLKVYSINNFLCDQLSKYDDMVVYPTDVCTVAPLRQGMCLGDSGGPLIYNGSLVGVTSRVAGLWCGMSAPVIFTKVAAYIDWIDDNMKKFA